MDVFVGLSYPALLISMLIMHVYSHRDTTYHDATVSASACSGTGITFVGTSSSLIGCSVLCSSYSDCVGMFYTESSGACVGCRQHFSNTAVSAFPLAGGTLYFQSDCKDDGSWGYFGGSYYKVYQLSKVYVEAKEYCRQQCSSIVHIDSLSELQFVTQIAREAAGTAYIGLEYDTATGVWGWADDGAPMTVSSWGDGEPTHLGVELCVALHDPSDYKWVDIGCDQRFSFICEKY